jgi:hypothetical protein
MAQNLDKWNGTQLAVIGTEHTLKTDTDPGVYTITVNLRNLAAADALELRVYKKLLTGDAQSWMLHQGNYGNVEGDAAGVGSSAQGEVLAVCVPFSSKYSYSVTLKQTAGTGRNFDWSIDQLA